MLHPQQLAPSAAAAAGPSSTTTAGLSQLSAANPLMCHQGFAPQPPQHPASSVALLGVASTSTAYNYAVNDNNALGNHQLNANGNYAVDALVPNGNGGTAYGKQQPQMGGHFANVTNNTNGAGVNGFHLQNFGEGQPSNNNQMTSSLHGTFAGPSGTGYANGAGMMQAGAYLCGGYPFGNAYGTDSNASQQQRFLNNMTQLGPEFPRAPNQSAQQPVPITSSSFPQAHQQQQLPPENWDFNASGQSSANNGGGPSEICKVPSNGSANSRERMPNYASMNPSTSFQKSPSFSADGSNNNSVVESPHVLSNNDSLNSHLNAASGNGSARPSPAAQLSEGRSSANGSGGMRRNSSSANGIVGGGIAEVSKELQPLSTSANSEEISSGAPVNNMNENALSSQMYHNAMQHHTTMLAHQQQRQEHIFVHQQQHQQHLNNYQMLPQPSSHQQQQQQQQTRQQLHQQQQVSGQGPPQQKKASSRNTLHINSSPKFSNHSVRDGMAEVDVDPRVMLEYLRNPRKYDCIVTIFHGKVAQKSYGNEKRFFAPPPIVYLLGDGWRLRKRQTEAVAADELARKRRRMTADADATASTNSSGYPPAIPCSSSADTAGMTVAGPSSSSAVQLFPGAQQHSTSAMMAGMTREGQQPLANSSSTNSSLAELCSFIGIADLPEQERLMLDFSRANFSAGKSLHISDSDKRKFFTLKVHFFYDILDGHRREDVGTFETPRIKVISKPAKRKQSTKNNECRYLCMASGTKVSLFNRLRSQSGSTRFLHAEGGSFNANSHKWGSFTIHLLDMDEEDGVGSDPDMTNFYAREGYVHYGEVVKLIDSVTGLALPPMRIRKIDKGVVLLNSGEKEPVSQLHKCAFQMLDDDLAYLSISNDSIVELTAQTAQDMPNCHTATDVMTWVIISTETTEFRFYESMPRPVGSQVGPVPILNGVKIAAGGTAFAYLFLEGRNFSSMLKVWLGATPLETFVSASHLIRCILPPLSKLNQASARRSSTASFGGGATETNAAKSRRKRTIEFPITLARRHDGVIYGTMAAVTYAYYNDDDIGDGNGGENVASASARGGASGAAAERAVATRAVLGKSDAFCHIVDDNDVVLR